MRILLTGASGFVGRRLVKALDVDDNELCLLIRGKSIDVELVTFLSPSVLIVSTDAKNWKQKVKEFKPMVVIHLAAFLTSEDDSAAIDTLIQSNISFGTHLLESLKGAELKYFINTGSFSEYGGKDKLLSPAYLYAATKTAFRSILEYFRLTEEFKVINVIPYTIYGYRGRKMKLIDYLVSSINANEPINMSPGFQLLDCIHLDDVVNFYVSLVRQLHKFSVNYTEIHLGSGTGITPREICKRIENITGKKANVNWGGIPYRQLDTQNAVADTNRPESLIEWKIQIDLDNGLKEYIKIIRESGNYGI